MGGVWELMFDLKEGRASSSSLGGKASKRRRVEERKRSGFWFSFVWTRDGNQLFVSFSFLIENDHYSDFSHKDMFERAWMLESIPRIPCLVGVETASWSAITSYYHFILLN